MADYLLLVAWNRTAAMSLPRVDHTATLLANGKVLVAGGANNKGTLKSCEVYDPVMETWTPTGSLNSDWHQGHAATLLADGRVLVVGGLYSPPASCELYDPQNGTWKKTAYLYSGTPFVALLLRNKSVFVTGGLFSSDRCFLFDPVTEKWNPGAPLPEPISISKPVLLQSGKVLLAVGVRPFGGTRSLVYDPTNDQWDYSGSSNLEHSFRACPPILLKSGKVLVADGPKSELFDNGVWSLINGTGASTSSLALLQDGRVMGGNTDVSNNKAIFVFQEGGGWSRDEDMNVARENQTFTALPNGKILVTGGANRVDGPLSSCEIYTP